ncbi:unnamed protein product [Clonostachys rosea f. rosea IK726]|uniref:Uncharacterized protein n=1 Tax=Clonostachys rosea f. rosea IK726 TaxID=1349383 RepID=A0ACA9UE25_BIOOC|nr:unnamed protein product [Clonostachys rosea f. rosea IK726]
MLPITPIVTAAPRGNAMSLGKDDSPAIWYVESPLWSNPEDDERVLRIHAEANEKIRAKLSAAGLGPLPFMYLSDIQKSQIPETFPAYGARNLRKMKAVRDKYDPDRVFTELVPGGAQGCLGLAEWMKSGRGVGLIYHMASDMYTILATQTLTIVFSYTQAF